MNQILSVLAGPKDAVVAQLRFHKVAGSKAPQSYYFQTETRAGGKRTVFSLEDMTSHLREIIELNQLSDITSSISETESNIKRRENWELRLIEEKRKINQKLVKARSKKDAQLSQCFLNTYVENPMQLVGRRIRHNVKETAEETPQWFDGTVKSIDKIPDDKMKTKYFVSYDLDGDGEHFSMPLLLDLKRGDLVTLS